MARQIKKPIDGRLRKLWKNLSLTVSNGYSYCKHSFSVLIMRWRNAVSVAAIWMNQIKKPIDGRLRKLWQNLSRTAPSEYPYYRHSLPVRIMHWSNVVFLAILLMSGLNIFNAHPALYWGKSSYSGVPPILEMGRKTIRRNLRRHPHLRPRLRYDRVPGPPGPEENYRTRLPVLAHHTRLAMACHGAALALSFSPGCSW